MSDRLRHARRYYLWSIGCQMNQADVRRLGEALRARGYESTRIPQEADLLILNTCVVRQSAQNKVTGRLNSLKPVRASRPDRALLVMGCYVGDTQELAAEHPFVDAFFRPSDVDGVLAFVNRWEIEHRWVLRAQGARSPAGITDMVPISYGCDHHCTYCIVTLRRGPQKSRAVSEIVADVEDLVSRGAREVTLLGQNVDAYGSDLGQDVDLADVLHAVHQIPGLWRIRFLTSHPQEMSGRIIKAASELPRVCPSWELAVQSGDNDVLRRMARGYTIERFLTIVKQIRAARSGTAINTDIIVGFPGETEEQFERSAQLLEQTRFDQVHIASYSPRPGTVSSTWEDNVPPEVKEARRLRLEAIQEQIAAAINARLLGLELLVLVDGQQRGRWRGRTDTNKLVFFASDQDWLGKMVTVRTTWTGPWSLLGDVVGVAPGYAVPLPPLKRAQSKENTV